MINSMTSEDIESILVQLNERKLPFNKYELSNLGSGMTLLGTGGFANVYEARKRNENKDSYAIKVIGFGNRNIDSKTFQSSVELQKRLGEESENVVKIYDFIQLRVWIQGEHTISKVEKIAPHKDAFQEGNYLVLQFIVMEKLTCVLKSNGFKREFIPSNLREFNEKEVMKIAYEIGIAINESHKRGLIHRDIKLENIFYDEKKKSYKLGDFGIAKVTDDGMAVTRAFSKGYGAPEVVGTQDDKYDNTADIYSFGMMIYLLLNQLKFPESENYRTTIFQYTQGYVPPDPVNGSKELKEMVIKMLSYSPNDRYQTMEEILNKFDELQQGLTMKFHREHVRLFYVLGIMSALLGATLWKMAFMPELEFVFDIEEYIFFILCVRKSIYRILRKPVKHTRTIQYVLFVIIILSCNRLTPYFVIDWWKIIPVTIVMFSSDYLSGILGAYAIIGSATFVILDKNNLLSANFVEYRWIAVLLISLSVILLLYSKMLSTRNEFMRKIYSATHLVGKYVEIIYFFVALVGEIIQFAYGRGFYIFGKEIVEWILSWNPVLVGVTGGIICLGWKIREKMLMQLNK